MKRAVAPVQKHDRRDSKQEPLEERLCHAGSK
jgi:hypothetical protein